MKQYDLVFATLHWPHSDRTGKVKHCSLTVYTNKDIITTPANGKTHKCGAFNDSYQIIAPRIIVFNEYTGTNAMFAFGTVYVDSDSNPDAPAPFAWPVPLWTPCGNGAVSVGESAFVGSDSENYKAFTAAVASAAEQQNSVLAAMAELEVRWAEVRKYETTVG